MLDGNVDCLGVMYPEGQIELARYPVNTSDGFLLAQPDSRKSWEPYFKQQPVLAFGLGWKFANLVIEPFSSCL